MYENIIQPTPRSKSNNEFSVRLNPMPVDEKVRYVESVCAALIDERFGRRFTPFMIDVRELWAFEEEVSCEMSDEAVVPSYVVHPYSKMARRDAADVIRHEVTQQRLSTAAARSLQRSPSNLGRGSPQISLGRAV